MHFSRYGDEFGTGLAPLDRDTVPVVLDLIQRTNPAKVRELGIEYSEDCYASDLEERKTIIFRPQSNATRRLPRRIYPLEKWWDPLSFPDKSTLVDTDEKRVDFMAVVQAVKPHDLELFCDCEGNKLGRNGTISLLQIMFASFDHTWVIDITFLKQKAFDTKGSKGRSLREILEDETIFKIFYDIRNDADALFSLHGIGMRHVIDMQLLELATCKEARRGRRGLSRCMTNASKEIMSWEEAAIWQCHKDNGKRFCESPRAWAVFDERPVLPVLFRYAVNDVAWMPALFTHLSERGRSNDMGSSQAGRDAMALVLNESERMVLHSTFKGYDPDGPGFIRGRAPPEFGRMRDCSDAEYDEEFWNE